MPFKEASMQHPTSCGQNILDTQVNGPYTASNEKQVLINLRSIRVNSTNELIERIYKYINEVNAEPIVFKWKYKLDEVIV